MSFDNVGRDTNEQPQVEAKSGRSGPSPALIGFAIVAALGVVFFFQNGEKTGIDFLFFEKRTTIRFSIVVAIVIGVLIDRLFSIWWRRRRRNKG